MSPIRVVQVLFRALLLVVLFASGIYMLVYLYRWEWNRALISGLVFLIAEVALATATTGHRLGRLERRIDDLSADARTSAVDRTRPDVGSRGATDEDALDPVFPWLEPGSFGVFIPVLLGVGAILSALAYVVERVAAATATEEARPARLAPLGLPDAVLGSGSRSTVPGPRSETVPVSVRAHRVAWIVALIVVLAAAAWSIVVLAGVAMYRPDPVTTSGSSSYSLRVDTRTGQGDPVAVAQTLWITCRPHVAPGSRLASIELEGEDMARIVVAPEVGRNDGRRFVGCLEDLRFDKLLIDVVTSPAP